MSGVRIFTNSVSDISPRLAEEFGVTLIPDVIIFEDREYLNNLEIDPPALYRLLGEKPKLPTTSHPSIGMYTDCFETAADYDEILCINLTTKMSGSYNTACIARDILNKRAGFPTVYTYDSLQVSHGLGIMVLAAARLAREGKTAKQIIGYLDSIKPHIGVYFVMKSLDNARKGGRVGAIRKLAADLLGVKPVLMFRDGLVRDVGIVRGFEDALSAIVERYRKQAKRGGEVVVFHADDRADAERVAERIRGMDPAAAIRIEWVGAVIGIYTGQGCVGLSFMEPGA